MLNSFSSLIACYLVRLDEEFSVAVEIFFGEIIMAQPSSPLKKNGAYAYMVVYKTIDGALVLPHYFSSAKVDRDH